MKKSDLKTGMRIVLRNKGEYIVLKNVTTPYSREDMYVSTEGGWMGSSSYNEDLTIKKGVDDDYDIMKVYAQNEGGYITGSVLKEKISNFKLIWERDDKKEMTISEIEKELGYSIKIVKEN